LTLERSLDQKGKFVDGLGKFSEDSLCKLWDDGHGTQVQYDVLGRPQGTDLGSSTLEMWDEIRLAWKLSRLIQDSRSTRA
jgi:hypothetical protein